MDSARKQFVVGILSDTHGYIDDPLPKELNLCDEIWHAGDIGNIKIINQLAAHKPLRAVHGNIDDWSIRKQCPSYLRFQVAGVDTMMIHIAGHPKKYTAHLRKLIKKKPPQILVCGHTHILRILYDTEYNMLYLNPGAIGIAGIQQVRTFLRLHIAEGKPKKIEVVELKERYPM